MELSFWIIIVISILMYIEGAVVGIAAGTAAKQSKAVLVATVIFWPIALPILSYKLYKNYWPLVTDLLPLLTGGGNDNPATTEGDEA